MRWSYNIAAMCPGIGIARRWVVFLMLCPDIIQFGRVTLLGVLVGLVKCSFLIKHKGVTFLRLKIYTLFFYGEITGGILYSIRVRV